MTNGGHAPRSGPASRHAATLPVVEERLRFDGGEEPSRRSDTRVSGMRSRRQTRGAEPAAANEKCDVSETIAGAHPARTASRRLSL